jgi:Family of unknown function (DUF6200)
MATPPKGGEQSQPQSGTARSTKRPIAIVDFGKAQSRGRIKNLRKGRGKLVSRVENIVDELLESPSIGKADPPVIVIVVREQASDSFGPFPRFPFG